jgi:hypothetical protein
LGRLVFVVVFVVAFLLVNVTSETSSVRKYRLKRFMVVKNHGETFSKAAGVMVNGALELSLCLINVSRILNFNSTGRLQCWYWLSEILRPVQLVDNKKLSMLQYRAENFRFIFN